MIKELKFERIIWENLFSLNIPSNWKHVEDNGVVNVYDETNGLGLLQLSFASRSKLSNNLVQEIEDITHDYMSQQKINFDKTFVQLIDTDGNLVSKISYESDNKSYWIVWHILSKNYICLVTYNCFIKDRGEEVGICNKIVNSFHWET